MHIYYELYLVRRLQHDTLCTTWFCCTCTVIKGDQVPGIFLLARKHHMYYNTAWTGARQIHCWPGNITCTIIQGDQVPIIFLAGPETSHVLYWRGTRWPEFSWLDQKHHMYYNKGWTGARHSPSWPGNITCTIIQGDQVPIIFLAGPETSHVLYWRGTGCPEFSWLAQKHHMYYNKGWTGARHSPSWPGNITCTIIQGDQVPGILLAGPKTSHVL